MLPVYSQIFTEEDAKAAYEVVKSGILSTGRYVKDLEDNFAMFTHRKRASTCSNGTVALYLALRALEIKNMTVAIPACGYVAASFAASMTDNYIEFIDCELGSWNIDLDKLEEVCKAKHIDAVIAIHNYGNPCNMDRLLELKSKYGFMLIEDACEAIGAKYKNKPVGSFGEISLFSFYGNKSISAGEGGILTYDNDELDKRIKLLRGQGQDPNKRFWHIIKGFNFRLTNLQAAVALSQFSRIDKTLERHQEVYRLYKQHLPSFTMLQTVEDESTHSWWMVTIRNPNNLEFYNKMSIAFSASGIESRPVFPPIPLMDAFIEYKNLCKYDNALLLHKTGICLPSGPGISEESIKRVCEVIKHYGQH